MKFSVKKYLKTLFLLSAFFVFSSNTLFATDDMDDLCYEKFIESGFKMGPFSMMYTTKIPIKNQGDATLTDIEVALATEELFSVFDECGVEDGDGNCSDANGKSFMMFSAFEDGIAYELEDLDSNESITPYTKSMFSFLDTSSYEMIATYVKDGVTHTGKIKPCPIPIPSGTSAPVDVFNVVDATFSGSKDPISASAIENRLPTRISGKNFSVKVLHMKSDKETLDGYHGTVSVAMIPTPAFTGDTTTDKNLCKAAIPYSGTEKSVSFGGSSSKTLNITNISHALQNASFRIKYSTGFYPMKKTYYVCSRDVFAIRPEKFDLIAPSGEDMELLTSADKYKLGLKAVVYSTSNPTHGYTITDAQDTLVVTGDKYQPNNVLNNALHGSITSTDTYHIVDGEAKNTTGGNEAVAIKFDDIGFVHMRVIDKTWAQVDIDNGDTFADCSDNGAYICGSIYATFIPDSFELLTPMLKNHDGSTFTYLSNDLNISADLELTIKAKNADGNVTANFDANSWENNITLTYTLPTPSITGVTENKSEIDSARKLGFTNGSYTISQTDTNNSKKLFFNFSRDVSDAKNPFKIKGSDITLAIDALYTSSSGVSKHVTGSAAALDDVTFLYGRTHTPRQRFTGNSGITLIYFENYCNGTGCDKSLLPDGINSVSLDDPRWFVNTKHTSAHGNAGVVSQKNGSLNVTATTPSNANPSSVTLNYDESRGYPFKTTLKNEASPWLIYNKYKSSATTNEFEVEFNNANKNWAGQHETDTATNANSSTKTNRRMMW